MFKNILVLLGCATLLAACSQAAPQNQVASGSPIDKGTKEPLTTYEFNGVVAGCKLYYVRPAFGNNFQFAACSNATTAWTESCGKNCSRNVVIHTE